MKYTKEIARNTKDPKILTEIFRTSDPWDEYICKCAIINPNCPPEILAEVLRREKDDPYSWHAVYNSSCTPEMLAEVLERGKDDYVSRNAALNPNCPPEARTNWMMKTGKIEKEDPKKHIIEYETIKTDDFQDLKDLL